MTTPAPAIADRALPGAAGLLEAEGDRVVRSFLGARGWMLEEARPVQATYRPGRSFLVRYRARATGPSGPRVLTLCAETSVDEPGVVSSAPDFADRFGLFDPVDRVGQYLVWTFPYDPSLRELPDAAWGATVRERGIGGADAVAVQPLRYRPRRRAVFRYRTLHRGDGWRTTFGKVIPSRKARRTLAASSVLRASGLPVTLPAQVSRQLLLVPELEGRSLRDLLVRGGSLPAPERLARIVRRIAESAPGDVGWSRPEPAAVAASTSRLLETLVPGLGGDVAAVLDAVGGAEAPAAGRLVHGDLYEAQVLVGRRYALGLIDLDDTALGDPAMDAANTCAHLLVLALSVPAAAGRLTAYRELARREFMDALGVSSAELAWREALCVLQLATGPFRVLDPRWPQEVGRRVKLAVRLLSRR